MVELPSGSGIGEKFPGIVNAIMLTAQEESDLHLVLWELGSLYPDVLPEERISAAKHIVRDLLAKKKIELQRYKSPRGAWEKVDPSRWESVLENSSNWEPTLPWRYLINLPGGKWT